jgi:hypothetical protein
VSDGARFTILDTEKRLAATGACAPVDSDPAGDIDVAQTAANQGVAIARSPA